MKGETKMRTKEELEALQAKLEEAMKDKDFAEKLMAIEEPEDVRKTLLEKDIDLSVEEIGQIGEALSKQTSKDGELSEDELEEAAGGTLIGALGIAILTMLGVSLGVGVTAAATRSRW